MPRLIDLYGREVVRLSKKGLKYELELGLEAFGPILRIVPGKILIENHLGLLEYSPELISVAARGGSIAVMGRGLRARAMNSYQLLISGRIERIDFGGADES